MVLEVVSFKECGSTNVEAHLSPLKNAWFITEKQLAGKGRMGREWVSPNGNLACSLKLTRSFTSATLPQLSFVAAFALRESLYEHGLANNITYKWPNDLLINGAKCAGILIEASTKGLETTVVIGMGVNLGDLPNIARETATLKGKITAKALFKTLQSSIEQALNLWNDGKGFPVILREYKKYAFGINETLTFEMNGEILHGQFIDISSTGSLLLKTSEGIKNIIAGEIVSFKG